MAERLVDVPLLSGRLLIGTSESARTRMGRAALEELAFVDRNDGAAVPFHRAMEFRQARRVWRLGYFAELTAPICRGAKAAVLAGTNSPRW